MRLFLPASASRSRPLLGLNQDGLDRLPLGGRTSFKTARLIG